jgi:UDP:flavonoid glycosyltransferase YjiC (YdhE family)
VKPLRATQLTVERLASRLEEVARRPELRTRAEALSAQLASENGAERAATLIEGALPQL